MDFELTSDQTLLRDTVRRFVEERVVPNAADWDRNAALPREVVSELAEMGLFGIVAPEACGGAGLGALELALVVEELAAGDGALALVVASHNALCCGHIARAGTDAQKQGWLQPLAGGEKLGGWAFNDPLGVTATRDGDQWILQGTSVLGSVGATAEVIVVVAQAKGEAASAFIVDPGVRGLRREPMHDTLGMRAAGAAELQFESVRVTETQRLGQIGGGLEDARAVLDRGRIVMAALAVGLGRGASAAARSYALERKQFGRAIAEFQAIQGKIADAATELEAARLLTWDAAVQADGDRPCTQRAAMAKLFASEAAMRAADEAVQVHGGYGYTTEFAVERFYRDAKLCAIEGGTSEMQRTTIAREALRAAGLDA